MEHPAKSSTEVTASSGSSEIVNPGLGVTTTTTEEQHSQEISTDDQGVRIQVNAEKEPHADPLLDDDEEPSMLDTLSSEQLARRPSFKKILDDLSAADQTLQKTSNSEIMSSAAVLQAQQLQAALQQVASSGGLTNTSLLPGILQGSTSTASGDPITSQLSVMLPAQQQIQLQSALLQSMNASSGVVQSLASQNNLPASLISSALINANVAANLNGNSSATNIGSGLKVGQPATSSLLEDTNRKREVRLMKNREAARECRRKKKEYVRCLESRVAVLESQNQALIGELRALKELYLPKSQDN